MMEAVILDPQTLGIGHHPVTNSWMALFSHPRVQQIPPFGTVRSTTPKLLVSLHCLLPWWETSEQMMPVLCLGKYWGSGRYFLPYIYCVHAQVFSQLFKSRVDLSMLHDFMGSPNTINYYCFMSSFVISFLFFLCFWGVGGAGAHLSLGLHIRWFAYFQSKVWIF